MANENAKLDDGESPRSIQIYRVCPIQKAEAEVGVDDEQWNTVFKF